MSAIEAARMCCSGGSEREALGLLQLAAREVIE